MSTDRRMLLSAAAALALPASIARAFAPRQSAGLGAQPAPSAGAGPAPALEPALERARQAGKPLLAILSDVEQAGQVWGEFFAHATDAMWLDLALVEVACLPRELFGKQGAHGGEPGWAVLIETDAAGGSRRIAGRLPQIVDGGPGLAHGAQVRTRAATLAALVRAAILPDAAAPARRAEQCLAGLEQVRAGTNVFELHGAQEAVASGQANARLADFDRFAAALRFRDLGGSGAGRDARLTKLALAARVRLYEQDPPGARWTTASHWCPPCGMGHLPAESRYALRFLAP